MFSSCHGDALVELGFVFLKPEVGSTLVSFVLPRPGLVGRKNVVVVVSVGALVAVVGVDAVVKDRKLPTFLPKDLRPRPIFCLSFCLKSSFRLGFFVRVTGGPLAVVTEDTEIVGVGVTSLSVTEVDFFVVVVVVVVVVVDNESIVLEVTELKTDKSTSRLGFDFDLYDLNDKKVGLKGPLNLKGSSSPSFSPLREGDVFITGPVFLRPLSLKRVLGVLTVGMKPTVDFCWGVEVELFVVLVEAAVVVEGVSDSVVSVVSGSELSRSRADSVVSVSSFVVESA